MPIFQLVQSFQVINICQTATRLCIIKQILSDFPVTRQYKKKIILVFYFFKVTCLADLYLPGPVWRGNIPPPIRAQSDLFF